MSKANRKLGNIMRPQRVSSRVQLLMMPFPLLLICLYFMCGTSNAKILPTLGPFPLQADASIHFLVNGTAGLNFENVTFVLDSETKIAPSSNCTAVDGTNMICLVDGPFTGTGVIYAALDADELEPIGYANRFYDASGVDPIVIEGLFSSQDLNAKFIDSRGIEVASLLCTLNENETMLTCPPLGTVKFSGAYQVGIDHVPPGFVPVLYDLWANVVPSINPTSPSIDSSASAVVVSFSGFGLGDRSSPYFAVTLSEGTCALVEVIEPQRAGRRSASSAAATTIRCTIDPLTPLTLDTFVQAQVSVLENGKELGFNVSHKITTSAMTAVGYVALPPAISDPPVIANVWSTSAARLTILGSNFYTYDATQNTVLFTAMPQSNLTSSVTCFGVAVSSDGTQLTCDLDNTALPLAAIEWGVASASVNGLEWVNPGGSDAPIFAFLAVDLLPQPVVQPNRDSIAPSQTFCIIHAMDGYGFLDGANTAVELSAGNCSSVEKLTNTDIICHFDIHPYNVSTTTVVELNVTSVVSTLSGYNYTVSTPVATIRPVPVVVVAAGGLNVGPGPLQLQIPGYDFSRVMEENSVTLLPSYIDCQVYEVGDDNLIKCLVSPADARTITAGPISLVVTVQNGVQSDPTFWDNALPTILPPAQVGQLPALTSLFTFNGTYFSNDVNVTSVTFFPGNVSCDVETVTPTSLSCRMPNTSTFLLQSGPASVTVSVESPAGSGTVYVREPVVVATLTPTVIQSDSELTLTFPGETPEFSDAAFHYVGAGFSPEPSMNEVTLRPRLCTYTILNGKPSYCAGAVFGPEIYLVSSSFFDGNLTVPFPNSGDEPIIAGRYLTVINVTGHDGVSRTTQTFYSEISPRIQEDDTLVNFFDYRGQPILSFKGVGFSSVVEENLVLYNGNRLCEIISVNYTDIVCKPANPDDIFLGELRVRVEVRDVESVSTPIRNVVYIEPPTAVPPSAAPFDDGIVSGRAIALGVFFGALAVAIVIGLGIVAYGKYKNRPAPPPDPKAYVPHEDRIPAGEILAALGGLGADDIEMSGVEMEMSTNERANGSDDDDIEEGESSGQESSSQRSSDNDDVADDDDSDNRRFDSVQDLDDSLDRI